MKLHDIKATRRRADLQVGDRVECRAQAYTPHYVGKTGVITAIEHKTCHVMFDDGTEYNGFYRRELKPL